MAGKQETGRGRNMWEVRGDERSYGKELTVLVEMEGEDRITMMELLKSVKEECGGVIGCRYKTPKEYELTMEDGKAKEKILDGLKIRNSRVMVKEVDCMEVVVSFLGLPMYIQDGEILNKLKDWGVTAASKIKRRMWPGMDIADGTRFLKVKFTNIVKSLPYSTKFETLGGTEHFRVIHDRQVKVCRLCIQPGHVVRDCPSFRCFRCDKQGHYARECKEENCNMCGMRPGLCVCETLAAAEDGNTGEIWPDLYEMEESEEEEIAEGETSTSTWGKEKGEEKREDIESESSQEDAGSRQRMRERKKKVSKPGKEMVPRDLESEDGDGKREKNGDEGGAKSQGGKHGEEKNMKKDEGGGNEKEIPENPVTNVEEDMDTREGKSVLRKRKKKRADEHKEESKSLT